MGNFLKFLFGNGNPENDDQEKNSRRNFDILKFDGLKALRIGKTAYAVRCFEEALNIGDDFETRHYLALALIREDEYDQALEIFDTLLQRDPEMNNIRLERATLCFSIENFEDCMEECHTILKQEPENYPTLLLLARAYHSMGKDEKAIENLTKAIEVDPDSIEAYLLRSEYLLENKNFACALEDVNKVLEISTDEEHAYLLKAKIYVAENKPDEAYKNYDLVIETNPFHEAGYLEKGKLLLDSDQVSQSLEFIDHALENIPDSARLYKLRSEIKNRLGDRQGAEKDMEKSQNLSETDDDDSSPVDFGKMYTNPI